MIVYSIQMYPDSTPCEPAFIRDPDFPRCSQKEKVCNKHPELNECKNDDGKSIPCYRHGILGSGGHDNRCHYPGSPFHPCGSHVSQFISFYHLWANLGNTHCAGFGPGTANTFKNVGLIRSNME